MKSAREVAIQIDNDHQAGLLSVRKMGTLRIAIESALIAYGDAKLEEAAKWIDDAMECDYCQGEFYSDAIRELKEKK